VRGWRGEVREKVDRREEVRSGHWGRREKRKGKKRVCGRGEKRKE
jgi:hypothetical protein